MEAEKHGSKTIRPPFSLDFPENCGISNSSYKGFSGMNSFHYCRRDFPPGCGPNAQKTTQNFLENVSESRKNSGFSSDSVTWRRNVAAVKGKIPIVVSNVKKNEPNFKESSERKLGERENVVEMNKVQTVKKKEPILKNSGERDKVLEMLNLFRKRCREISQSGRGIRRIDTTAYAELKREGKLMSRSAEVFGSVPGVEVGDKFHYRIELSFVGLHKHFERGIDSMEWGGSRVATCIVASERHLDKMNDPNALIYIGEGGALKRNQVGIPPDQELKAGNRALWNSMKEKKEVRVVRGLTSERFYGHKVLYVYDGLYEVKSCEKKKGPQGNMIFQFQLTRCTGQPAVPWQVCRRYQF
ncbi:hypothetical protein BVRB_2g032890 [Beta vulgaris subsp. vulgaris]|uniref:histone-lysine N-methyltransferase, H3 lysine-9 specific SUVH5 n=1 Tax=Beta vulgaris subsp. vulgaris TaxID=3555 RepID=UPI00054000FA|nr:histone-lysine N-methyltransferase, H3 lysine-9 specific SUVH5 [Beta vulgaris subsp. vulgaris]XP_048495755.1 histone-lysine N-methyltransferase, H3 lysine-9 specific SUVH5 [Beta vulgaris subsp. vulgaris]XP_048495756.1 histone-lysine N-methyltransferase, H3 lysine-9 specific SUVH5 [Beta vulgaris subsp. vulgaris]XP_057248656.1 histone-lysine N-methyltransferase, H3 lysine-9 specific SUVH5 [Beta vulgaris subsp. vulgaris]KMT18100.1 hypothetical protein BVRB_2g032890 [Beta vulgaris subsp. vulgari